MPGLNAPLQAGALRLDPLGPDDAQALWPVLREPALYTFLDQPPPASVETLHALFTRIAVGHSADGRELWGNWVLRSAEGRAIGHWQTTVVAPATAWVAYVLDLGQQGRGHGRAATAALIGHLRGLGVQVCQASVEAANHRSARLLQALGFSPTDAETAAAEGLGPSERLWRRRLDGAG